MHRQNIEVFASTVFLSFYADICYIQIDNIFSPLRKYKELMLCIGKITYTEEGPMDKKKVDFKSLVADKGKAATDLFDKTKKAVVQSIDQNEDGKFDLSDITVLTDQWNERKEQQRKESDRKRLCPIFEEDLDSPDFLMTKLIRVCEMDKKHAESDICQGSIGFESVYKDLRVINIYLDKAAAFGLSYYPDIDRQTILGYTQSAAPIEWNLTLTDAGTLEGTKKTLVAKNGSVEPSSQSVVWTKK